ncbi:hypothetical protein DSQ19_05645 [Candidatus Nitrosotenuis sp. DW1]|nr:hypothetical protein DSQ19_05645 [Candidatus Nitrosotenuis sp. DW1]
MLEDSYVSFEQHTDESYASLFLLKVDFISGSFGNNAEIGPPRPHQISEDIKSAMSPISSLF